ncbi:hypothetical protein ZIOFF_043339 [Zingiber officinale]|uniref:Uncharacterized protein n=1 Tax=Zingiber officinale TaxID=94328 RepID=A0A8J5G3Y4_ZINOF|nr:hypothetical protein ZIOFF_043339 [Zingiber officinale]
MSSSDHRTSPLSCSGLFRALVSLLPPPPPLSPLPVVVAPLGTPPDSEPSPSCRGSPAL